MGYDPARWLDGTGFADSDDEAPGLSLDPLESACENLNFVNSLARDAHQLHRRVLDVLMDIVAGQAQAVSRLEATAASLGPGAAQHRLRVAAARARTNLSGAKVRWRQFAAIDVGEPGPAGWELVPVVAGAVFDR